MLVKTAKEACAEGLIVTGGGKDGIFIKEVKPDSPASKHLRVKEGRQRLGFCSICLKAKSSIIFHYTFCQILLTSDFSNPSPVSKTNPLNTKPLLF